MFIVFQACAQKNTQVFEIEFKLFHQGIKLNCENLASLPVELQELRFYLHNLKYAEKSVPLSQNEFQSDNVAYVDLLATLRHCGNSLKFAANQVLTVTKQVSDEAVLSFQLGVPLHLNHQNPVKAPAPLNRSDMHWQWLSGYKFFRLEYMKAGELNRFHLGSIGCEGKLPNDVECKFPNRLQITLPEFDFNNSFIEVHIDELIKPQISTLCMGDPKVEGCAEWFDALQNNVFKLSDH